MTNFEQSPTQEAIDEQVVGAIVPRIEAYLQGDVSPEQQAAYLDAGRYIADLYDEFAPETAAEARETGTVLGAAGLALVQERFGRDEYSPKLYGGSYENRVLATYHHAGHSRMFIRSMFVYAAKVNQQEPGTYGPDEYMRFPAIGAFHDLIMGNGRGHDERQSALLASRLMQRVQGATAEDEETAAGVAATTWDDQLGAQSVKDGQSHLRYRRAAGVADLLSSVFEATGPYAAVCLMIEDMCKRKEDQLFVKEADAAGFSLEGATIEDCLQFVDTVPVLQARFAEILGGQAGFAAGFKPADPRLDAMFAGRSANVAFRRELSERYNAGDMSALQTLQASRDFMRA